MILEFIFILVSGARGPPQFLKKRSENAGANENLLVGFVAIPGIDPRVAPRIVGFVEWNFQFREVLREYPGTLRELREWPCHSESVFPEIGVVPRFLIILVTLTLTLPIVFGITILAKIIADPEKCFEEMLTLFRDRPCLELIIVSSHFQALLLL